MSHIKAQIFDLRKNNKIIIKESDGLSERDLLGLSKPDIRTTLLKERLSLSEVYVKEASLRMCKIIEEIVVKMGYDYLLVYIPFNNEVDLSSFFTYPNVFVPRICEEKSTNKTRMDFVKISKDLQFTKNRYGILEPISDISLSKIDITEKTIVIVPALAISLDGYRLGYGGGYYDEFLCGLDCLKIGVVFKDFIVNELPKENHDQRLDMIITD